MQRKEGQAAQNVTETSRPSDEKELFRHSQGPSSRSLKWKRPLKKLALFCFPLHTSFNQLVQIPSGNSRPQCPLRWARLLIASVHLTSAPNNVMITAAGAGYHKREGGEVCLRRGFSSCMPTAPPRSLSSTLSGLSSSSPFSSPKGEKGRPHPYHRV